MLCGNRLHSCFATLHSPTASAIHNCAGLPPSTLYEAQGRYHKAEPLYKGNLAIRETAPGLVSVEGFGSAR
jgi:hypothetical protein